MENPLILQEQYVDQLGEHLIHYFLDKSNDDDNISNMLRYGIHPTDTSVGYIREIIDSLDTIFSNVPPTTIPFYVYRGVDKMDYLNLSGFCSTSLYSDIALGGYATPQGCIMKILIPNGSHVIPLYNIPIFKSIGEKEVLLDRKNIVHIDPISTKFKGLNMYHITYTQK